MGANDVVEANAPDEANGDEKAFDNVQTWPKCQLSHRGLSELNEWIQLESILNQAKTFISACDNGESVNNRSVSLNHSRNSKNVNDTTRLQAATQLIDRLSKELEKRAIDTSDATNRIFRKQRESVGALRQPRYNSISGASTTNMNMIREDPHFESMIICDTTVTPKSYGSMDTVRSIPPFSVRNYDNECPDCNAVPINEMANAAEMPGESIKDPIVLRAIPHLLLLICVVLYLTFGVYLFGLLDDRIRAKPLHIVLLFVFQTCTSIGWGDTSPTNRWSQLFCVVYTTFGVPIIFSAFANIGRLMTEFYCIDWLFLTSVVRERVKIYTDKIFPNSLEKFQALEVRRRFPIRATINLLFIHQCIGVLIYGSLVKQYTVIQVIYFSITSMATTGYGDIRAEPESMLEAIIIIVYISSGIIIFSALLLSIGYYFQRIIYVIVPNYLQHYYERYRRHAAVIKCDVNDGGKNIA